LHPVESIRLLMGQHCLGIKNHNDDPRPIANPHEVSPDWKNAYPARSYPHRRNKGLGCRQCGQIFMPMQETFFAVRFAMLRHKCGTSWSLIARARWTLRFLPGARRCHVGVMRMVINGGK